MGLVIKNRDILQCQLKPAMFLSESMGSSNCFTQSDPTQAPRCQVPPCVSPYRPEVPPQ